MKGNMMIFAPLCLLLCGMLPVDSMMIRFNFTLRDAYQEIPLSMAEDSVDDMYFGCNQEMMKMIKDKYFKNENNNSTFMVFWNKAQDCANKKLEQKDKGDEALTKDHMQAICVYTSGYKMFHRMFNDAIQNGMSIYSTFFSFHSLHFWLTSAVQILSNNIKCHTTYRRTSVVFTGNVNQIIRFGFFASSSYKTTLTHFGKKTCFKIKTCSGGFLKHYSYLKDAEQEVLIPPYEEFKITMKTKGLYVDGLSDCEVVYILESAGVHSNLNCNAAHLETSGSSLTGGAK
ncbi:ecto-ADP-ribosyltransferase 5-like [Siniperca chuatsi]|uniref:ecto-ADP-ribosyltransferase 5-like n=1 Tax=Siniperca chuatsi TaxID=119488 RepID=UPI001CE1DC16|nr:ecto-ADP-ribosyltransferase 5-like [Siniperca chuatsi]